MRILRAPVVAVAITLGGCATPGGGPPPTVAVVAQEVKDLAIQICHYSPYLGTIVALITANPTWKTAADFAVAICNTVTAPKGHYRLSRRGTPMIGNVVINGRFVR